jgi:hypothetical protein
MYSYTYEVRYSCAYEVPTVQLHLPSTAALTRYSYTYEVQLHLRGKATPARYSYIYEVQATPTRYNYTYEVQLHLRSTATPTLEKTTKIIFEIYLSKLAQR